MLDPLMALSTNNPFRDLMWAALSLICEIFPPHNAICLEQYMGQQESTDLQ